jgi:hypothetical protein
MIFFQKKYPESKKYYLCGGEMAERSNAAVLKTVDLLPRIRGFESLFLRQNNLIKSLARGIFCFIEASQETCFRKVLK